MFPKIQLSIKNFKQSETSLEAYEEIIEDKKSSWAEITVWAYKNSEKDSALTMGATMGMKEYSTCE